jgi:hypothetical protein
MRVPPLRRHVLSDRRQRRARQLARRTGCITLLGGPTHDIAGRHTSGLTKPWVAPRNGRIVDKLTSWRKTSLCAECAQAGLLSKRASLPHRFQHGLFGSFGRIDVHPRLGTVLSCS